MADAPDWPGLVRRRLEASPLSRGADSATVDELAQHLAETYERQLAAGLAPEAARRAAESELDHLEPLARAVRSRLMRVVPGPRSRWWLSGIGGDLRQAARGVRLRPSFSAVVVFTLAIGIGACATVFSIGNAVFLKSLPYPASDRLVLLWEADARDPASMFIAAAPVYEDVAKRNRTLEHVGIWEFMTFNVAAGPEPEQADGIRASASLFRVLGVAPALGRSFTDAEDAPGHQVAVISDSLWRSQFGADPHALGRQIRLNGEPYDVIGVMPPAFVFPRRTSGVFVPIAFRAGDLDRDAHSFYVAGRLRDGVSFDSARGDVQRIGRELAAEYSANKGEAVTITPMADLGTSTLKTMMTVLFEAVALVLAIACVNVANLHIGMGLSRRREFVTRIALGATVGRLARLVLAEALVLALSGAAGGVLVAWIGTRGLDALLGPGFFAFWFRDDVAFEIDGRVLLFAAAAGVTSALFFGLAPLAMLRRASQPGSMHGTRGSTRSIFGARRWLIAVEVALSVVVLCGAGLLVKSLAGLLSVRSGLQTEDVITLEVSLPQPNPYGSADRATFCDDLQRSAGGSPVFASVGAVSHLPLSGANATRGFTIEGRPPPRPNEGTSASYRVVCPGYFRTLGIPFLSGGDFSGGRPAGGAVILNRVAAERYWPAHNPIGQRLKLGSFTSAAPWMTVVGVVENVRHFGLDSDAKREIFVPYGQAAWPVMTLVAKANGESTATAQQELKDILKRVDPALPAARLRTMDAVVGGSVSWRASFMRLLIVFAAIGLALAAVGVYSVLAYYVSQRTRELGVRVALGASRRRVLSLVLRQSLVPVAAGIVIGLPAAVWSGRLLSDLLFKVTPADPVVGVTIVSVLAAVRFLASWLPARRAASIDPVAALRDE